MGKTLKTIKVLFTIDVDQFRKNIHVAEKAIGSASKQIEKSNQGITNSNEKITQSSEQIAKSNAKAAEAHQDLARSSGILSKSLGILRGSLSVAGDAAKVMSVSVAGVAITAIKLFPLIQKLGLRVQRTGLQMDLFAATVGGKVFKSLLGLLPVVAKIPSSFGRTKTAAILAVSALGDLNTMFLKGTFAVSKFLLAFGPVRAVSGHTARSIGTVTTGVGSLLAAASKQSTVFGRMTKSFRTVGIAMVPFVNKLLSVSAILPSLGLAVTFFAGKALFGLAKWLRNAAGTALEFARNIASTADALAKTSGKLGVHVETLQQYQFAANLAGVKQEALNVGLQRFLRRTAEARQGVGVLSKEFTALGIALVDSNGNVRRGTDVFEDYLNAIDQTADKQEQLRLAFAAFDTEGVALVNLAKTGAEGFLAQRIEAERLGIVLSSTLLSGYERVNDQLTINSKRVEAARLRNGLFLAEMAAKWDTFKTSIKVASLELVAFLRPLEARTSFGLTQKLEETEEAIERTSKALNSSIANLPLVTGTLEVFLGGLIEDQERILEAIQIAKRDEVLAKQERPDAVTRAIEEQIATQERVLEQQLRLTEAAKQGEEARRQMAITIDAENAARQLGIQATEAEQASITAYVTKLRESEFALQQINTANMEFAKGSDAAADAMGRMADQTGMADSAMLQTIQTEILLQGTTRKSSREFQELSNTLKQSVSALESLKKKMKTAGTGAELKKMAKEADRLQKLIAKTREKLQKMEQGLKDTSIAANETQFTMQGLGDGFANAANKAKKFNDELENQQGALAATAGEARNVDTAIQGMQRSSQSLGSVVGGQGSSQDIQRALNSLNAQLQQVRFASNTYGFRSIQTKALRAQIDALEADLRLANEQARGEIIDGILRANEELSGEALQRTIDERLAVRERYGILPTSTSSRAGYQSMATV